MHVTQNERTHKMMATRKRLMAFFHKIKINVEIEVKNNCPTGTLNMLNRFGNKNIAFSFRQMNDYLKDQLVSTIRQTFSFNQQQTEKLYVELMLCMKRKELVGSTDRI